MSDVSEEGGGPQRVRYYEIMSCSSSSNSSSSSSGSSSCGGSEGHQSKAQQAGAKSEKNSAKGAKMSWRDKCIVDFQLQPVPSSWKDEVATVSDKAWQEYYAFRIKHHENSSKQSEDDEDDGKLVKNWRRKLNKLVTKTFREGADESTNISWHCTVFMGLLSCDGPKSIQSAMFCSYVWSPYAIPHALAPRTLLSSTCPK
jgi:hypothetical protein